MAPQRIPGGAQKFRASSIYLRLKAVFPNIDQILQENGAIIAGSSVLGALVEGGNEWSSDVDIYVPIPNDKTVHTLFRATPAIHESRNHAKSSSYCMSFMRRNGIRTVVNYSAYVPGNPFLYIDIMAVRKKTSPLQVAQNFDLTFCQVWYDGREVWATHPQHIQTKVGFLQGDYVPIYLSGNRFLKKRMQKYVNRGFKVGADKDAKKLTKEILDDFQSVPDMCSVGNKHSLKETGIPWARKTMFRACFKPMFYYGANAYSSREDGYDSDEYVETPNKLVDLAGSMDELCQRIHRYLGEIEGYFNATVCDFLDEFKIKENFTNPLVEEIKQLCGTRFREVTGDEPEIELCMAQNNETNYNGNSGNSEGNYGNNGNNERNYENTENYMEEARLNRVPAISPAMNRALTTRPTPIPGVTECYDPYMASTVEIADNQVLFYIFGKPVGNNAPPFIKAACIDNEGDDQGQQIQLYRKFLDDISYIYYQCKPTVPRGALFITRAQTTKEPLRRLAFDSNIYVYEAQAKKIQAGRKYALIPTETTLGRIVSETLLQTADAVSAEHCQTDYSDKIHEIFEIVEPAQGGMRLRRLAKEQRKARKTRRYRKDRNQPKRKQTRMRR